MFRALLFFFYAVSLILFSACTGNEDEVNQQLSVQIEITQTADGFILDGSNSNPGRTDLTFRWSSSSDKIIILQPSQEKTSFRYPATSESFDVIITLEISNNSQSSTDTQTIHIDISANVEAFGIGKILSKIVSDPTDYEWYLDQGNSGTYALENCGPTVATMAAKWNNDNFTGSPAEARQKYRPAGGWWFTSNIISYLKENNISNQTIQLYNFSAIKDEIDNGNIIILCLDMYFIHNEVRETDHVNRFYAANNTGWGHFIIVKGYVIVDDQIFYETYDPYSLNARYSDNTLKGKNRYYKEDQLDQATNIWWDYAIIISKNSFSGRSSHPYAVDPDKIRHQSGK